MSFPYKQTLIPRAEIDALPGPALLQFGADWCGHCQAAEGPVNEALSDFPDVRQIKIEDGPGRPLGRSFRIRLWPTLIFLSNGHEVGRLVRPTAAAPVRDALAALVSGAHSA